MKKKPAKTIAQYGCMLAFAMAVSYVEAILPIHIGIPGAKLGLANVAIVYCMYMFGTVPALVVNLCRIVLVGILFGSPYSMLYSFTGAVFSFVVMVLLKQVKNFSIIGVSIAGGVMHNVGQTLLAIVITKVAVLSGYLPILCVVGALTGLLNGYLAKIIIQKTKKISTEK